VRVLFLGTGTSQGVPLIGCACAVCKSNNKKDKRLRSSILVESETTKIVVDTGPDFRQQMLVNNVTNLDAVLFTHGHKDHVAGLDDIRAYNYILQKPMDVFASKATQETIQREFPYIFEKSNYPGIPKIKLHTISKKKSFIIGDILIEPIEVMHLQMPVLGFTFNKIFTYITDANFISKKEFAKLLGSKIIVLNALRHEKHISHFSLTEAMALASQTNVTKTYFTHISHQLGKHEIINKKMPKNMQLAYDGLELHL
jgi:phosphoribosyl 1,2-cyclic phosphate phosphodiesterase